MNTREITNPSIHIKPSKKLLTFIDTVKICDIPVTIFDNNVKDDVNRKPTEPKYLITAEDRRFVKSLKLDYSTDYSKSFSKKESITSESDKFFNLQDLRWLYSYLQEKNMNKLEKVYLHELLEGSQIILPKNSEISRDSELEKRCECLRNIQQNKEYNNMTKNVDNIRRKLPEDTVSFQIKQMNRHVIVIFQLILSVLAGFVFGLTGIELLTGSLDFGFRLLLGTSCALIIALAELYFLTKKLNEDLKFETAAGLKK